MRVAGPMVPQIVVHQYGSSWPEPATGGAGQDTGQRTEHPFRAAPVVDPHRVQFEEPIRWAAYINATFPRDGQALHVFGVCEKTLSFWRRGERAPRAHQKTIAERVDGDRFRDYMHGGDVVGDRWRKS